MSDREEERLDRYRNGALNGIISLVEDHGGGLEYTAADDARKYKVRDLDLDAEFGEDLIGVYLEACKAQKIGPLVAGKRQPRIAKIVVELERESDDDLTDEENDTETSFIHRLFADLPDDVEVDVQSADGVHLYDGHREV